MPVGVVVANVALIILTALGTPTMIRVWQGDRRTQKRLRSASIVRAGGTGDPRWVRSIAPRFVALAIFDLLGPVYLVVGGGRAGDLGVFVCFCLGLVPLAVAASVFWFGRPTFAIPPNLRPHQRDHGTGRSPS
jgi:ABC-type transport system involved in cytochrome c biogenesis permease subunit